VKPPPFEYHAPESVAEALRVLGAVGHEGKVLAGGQSLLPLLTMRLAAPAHIVDINRLEDELGYVRVGDGAVRVGALARHADVEHDPAAARAQPLLAQALRHVAHPAIRNRGTTVGSLAHADPAGELTAVLALTGGAVELAREGSARTVGAAEFFVGPLESAIEPGELAVAATFPAFPARTGSAFVEVARRHGDYAVCGVAAAVTLADDLRVTRARVACISVGPTPVVLDLADEVAGGPPATADWGAAGRRAADSVDPDGDIHATAAYRKHLAGVLAERALRAAAEEATRWQR
jgi:carbon-monoxide dehydrogenase medium subunit